MKIDSHQHFWKYDPITYSWIDDDMAAIRRDFAPDDLKPLLAECGIDGCVIVQADQSEADNDFQLNHAENHDFIKGIVGWVELKGKNIEERLEYYSQFKKLKGFRHVLQDDVSKYLMRQTDFLNGVSLLNKYNFTYDVLVKPGQMEFALEFVAQFPDQKFVLDHIAKPFIKDQIITGWDKDIVALAKFDNVQCKISGMVTEADWENWKSSDFTPYIDTVVNAFGIDRVMYGSDWPVCTLGGTYSEVYGIVQDYFAGYSEAEQAKVFGQNAIGFYSL